VVAGSRRDDRTLWLRSLRRPEPVELDLDGLAPGALTGWASYAGGVA
jgi:hypothetical protein